MSFLVITLRTPPTLQVRGTDSPVRLSVGRHTFFEVTPSGQPGLFLGFYDWLRSREGEIVGLRLMFHDGRDAAVEALRQSKVGEWDSPEIYRLLFRAGADIDQGLSIDQEFSVSRLYENDENELVLLIDVSDIEEEFNALPDA
jgi:hypothetical protein